MKDQVRAALLFVCLTAGIFLLLPSGLLASPLRPVKPASVNLYDDFEDGNADGWTFIKGTWSVVSGRLTGTVTKKGVAMAPLFGGCSQCVVEGDILMDTPGTHASLLAWYTDKKNGVEIRLMEEKNKLLLKFLNNGVLVLKAKALVQLDPSVDYNIRALFTGGSFQVFVNDAPVLTAPSSVTPNGGVGFQIKSTGPQATASLGQIAVYPAGELKVSVTKSGVGTGTVSSTPPGISCGASCFDTFSASSVALDAVADVGSSFTGWTGDCTGTGPCNLTMDSDKSVQAAFGTALGNGSPCTGNTDCQSGFCVDQFCCESACNGLCQTCSATPGSCTSITAGTDPDNECATDPVSTCGQDGFCNGAGACELYGTSTICAAAFCSGTVSHQASMCDGGGACVPGFLVDCTPFNCDGTTGLCFTVCSTGADCAPGHVCLGGSCF